MAHPLRVSQKDTFFFYVLFFLFVQKEKNQRKRAPEMITSTFFGKMPYASRSQKRLKFAPFPVCPRASKASIFTIKVIRFNLLIVSANLFEYE
jgi:hypothetical protein